MTATGDRLVPGGGLQGPLFATLLARLTRGPREVPSGRMIGPYRVIEPLGHGGMAVVYLAERVDGEFNQRVALKVITADRDSRIARDLLRRERQILASLHHPNIARLLDGGSTDDGLLWFAMEPVQGERIDRHCRERGLALDARLRLYLKVCDAVRFAHARLLVHRDIKPANILVGDDGDVKLLDFGIAAVLADEGGNAPPALTPGFASPEQRRGDPATTASDVWQLGTLLELLTGDIVAMQPRRSRDLIAIIQHASQTEIAQRYESVADLAADVGRLLERRPVQARGGGPFYRVARFLGRHRWSSVAVSAVVAGMLAMSAHFAWSLAQERTVAAHEAERANAAIGYVVDMFRIGAPDVSRGQPLDARQLLARGTERLATELTDQPALRAKLLMTIGNIQLAIGEPALARPLFGEAVELARGLPDSTPTMLATALEGQGLALLEVGDPIGALRVLTESVAIDARDRSVNRRPRDGALNLLSMAQMGSGDLASALATQQESVGLALAVHGEGSRQAGESLLNLAVVLRTAGRTDESMSAALRAWRTLLAVQGKEHPSTLAAQKTYAYTLLDAKRITEARPLIEETVDIQRRLYHGSGAKYASGLRTLGQLYAKLGDDDRALEHFLQAEAMYMTAVGGDSITLAWLLVDVGDLYEAKGDHVKALSYYERTLAARRHALQPDHITLAAPLDGCARQLLHLGRPAEAERFARESLAVRSAKMPTDSPDLARSLLPLGAALRMLGRRDEGDAQWQRAFELIDRAEGRNGERWQRAQRFVAQFSPSN